MNSKNSLTSLYLSLFLLLCIFIFCGDPVKPPFDIPPKIENDTIITYGTPEVDSSYLMYVVISEGTEPLTFQWSKNNTIISGASDDSLLFISLTLADNGVYKCIVSNEYGIDTSLACTLTVITSVIDTTKPVIKLNSPPDSSTTADSILEVEYIVTDESGLSSVTINDSVVTSNDSLYKDTLILSEGYNTVKVIAIDASLNNNTDTLYSTFYYDTSTGNHAPEWLHDTMHGRISEGETYSLNLSDSCIDQDGDTITFSLLSNVRLYGDTIIGSIYQFTSGFDDSGVYSVIIQASDGEKTANATLELTVLNVNRPPRFLTEDSLPQLQYLIGEGDTLVIQFKAEDPDSEQVTCFLAYTTLPNPGTIVFTQSQLEWIAGINDEGQYDVRLGATDGQDTGYVDVMVGVGDINFSPVISIKGLISGQTVSVKEQVAYVCTVSVSDINAGDTAVLLSAANAPYDNPAAGDGSYDTASGVFTYTPSFSVSNQSTNHVFDSIAFYAKDKADARDTFYINIEIIDSNRAPVLSSIGNQSGNENEPLTFAVTATDPDGDAITLSATNLPDDATFTDNGDGTGNFSWITDFNDVGNYDNVTFTASDGDLSDLESITISIGDVNRPPVLSSIGDKSVDENQNLSFTVTASDPDGGDVLTLSSSTLATGASFNTSNGAFSWTPSYSDSGTYNIIFTVIDNGTPQLSDNEEITITVNNVNRAPVLGSIGDKNVYENQALNFIVTATDPDNGDVLTLSSSTLPTGASFNTSSGAFSWTPSYNDSGTYNITFTVTDNGTPQLADNEEITITVINVNRPPYFTTTPSNATLEMGGATYTAPLQAEDPDGDALTITLSNEPPGLTYNGTNEEMQLVLDRIKLLVQTYSNVTATVNDGNGGEDSHVWDITINAHTWELRSSENTGSGSVFYGAENSNNVYSCKWGGRFQYSVDGGASFTTADDISMAYPTKDIKIYNNKIYLEGWSGYSYGSIFAYSPTNAPDSLGNTEWQLNMGSLDISNNGDLLALYWIYEDPNTFLGVVEFDDYNDVNPTTTNLQTPNMPDRYIDDIMAARGNDYAFVTSKDNGLYRKGGGSGWAQQTISGVSKIIDLDVASDDGDTVYVVDSSNLNIYMTSNGRSTGTITFTSRLSGLNVMEIEMLTSKAGWAITAAGDVYFTNDCFQNYWKENLLINAQPEPVKYIVIAADRNAVFAYSGETVAYKRLFRY